AEECNHLDFVHAETVGQIDRKMAAARHEAVTIHGERYPGRSQLTHERERRHTATSAIPSATAGCTRYAGDSGRPGLRRGGGGSGRSQSCATSSTHASCVASAVRPGP